jgi:hypothetical protein
MAEMSIAEIVEVLGGAKIFPQPVLQADDLVVQVRAGLPPTTVSMLAGVLSMQRAQVAKCLGIPPPHPEPQAGEQLSAHA